MNSSIIDIPISTKFFRLTVIARSQIDKNRCATWLCRCECGKEIIARGYALRRGETKSCGCLSRDLAKLRKTRLKAPGVAAGNTALGHYKKGARKRKLSWELSRDEFFEIVKQRCHYCESGPSNVIHLRQNTGDFIYNGIDRVDNSLGYLSDNIVPSCRKCNTAKGKQKVEDFISWACRIADKARRGI